MDELISELMFVLAQDRQPLAQVENDAALVKLWLQGRSAATCIAYARDIRAFLAYVSKPLRAMSLEDVQAFVDSRAALNKPASQRRRLASIKSLFSFAYQLGYVSFNIGAAVQLPSTMDGLAERVMDESEVHRMLALEPVPRNAALLYLLYTAGLRATEVTGLCWQHLQARDDAGQVTINRSNGKTRVVLLPASVWHPLAALRGDAAPDAAVFSSTWSGGHISRSWIHRIVKAAAKRVGLSATISARWMLHAHVRHALDRGAATLLVQATVGHNSITKSDCIPVQPSDSSANYLGLD